MKNAILSAVLLCFAVVSARAQDAKRIEDPEKAYTQAITERADKNVATLGITDAAKANRVRDLIVQQYRDLRAIHDPRDVRIKAAKDKAKENKEAADAEIKAAQDEAKVKLDKLHVAYLAKLSAELTPEQVDKVKDGMTYGVLQVTYDAYLKMYPDLKDDQKAQIKAWLVEAREIAMDGSTSNEKHAVFGKYKGRINNYLSKAGYDAKKAEENLKK
jgi:Spy/CpxP family protein refolding chaperone